MWIMERAGYWFLVFLLAVSRDSDSLLSYGVLWGCWSGAISGQSFGPSLAAVHGLWVPGWQEPGCWCGSVMGSLDPGSPPMLGYRLAPAETTRNSGFCVHQLLHTGSWVQPSCRLASPPESLLTLQSLAVCQQTNAAGPGSSLSSVNRQCRHPGTVRRNRMKNISSKEKKCFYRK